MTQLSVMDLAKQGDPQAIAALINRSLASKGIHAEAQLEADCLNISLKAAQTPNQKAVVAIIHRGMMILQVDRIKRVNIFTYRSDNNYLAWQYELILDQNLQLAEANLASPVTSANGDNALSSQLEQAAPMNLVSNPKGVILVQKLSQIQQNLQEYQDIIVRFTDEQVGTVKCLTTLNELIHVVSKPSFLFTSVAANPSLRSLLDAIAESSRTNEHGDQVITNLSILQPGQQWQKAKIRLVSKIFLEPDQEAEESANSEIRHQGITVDLQETTPQIVYPQEPAIAPIITPATTPVKPEFAQTSSHSPRPIDNAATNSPVNQRINHEISEPKISESVNQRFSPSESIDFGEDIAPPTSVTEEESITLNSLDFLGDDFGDDSPVPSQTVTPQPVAIPEIVAPQINLGASESLTASSLFDDFGDNFGEDTPPVKVIDDVTEIETADSLFEQFGEPSLAPVNNLTSDADESDLFGDFIVEPRSRNGVAAKPSNLENSNLNFLTNNEDETVFQEDLEILKSRIPKQNLDNLLSLMQEEENQKQVPNPPQAQDLAVKTDIGASTIEQILGNMETITLNPAGSSANSSANNSPNFVTLEDFSEDLESVGF